MNATIMTMEACPICGSGLSEYHAVFKGSVVAPNNKRVHKWEMAWKFLCGCEYVHDGQPGTPSKVKGPCPKAHDIVLAAKRGQEPAPAEPGTEPVAEVQP